MRYHKFSIYKLIVFNWGHSIKFTSGCALPKKWIELLEFNTFQAKGGQFPYHYSKSGLKSTVVNREWSFT